MHFFNATSLILIWDTYWLLTVRSNRFTSLLCVVYIACTCISHFFLLLTVSLIILVFIFVRLGFQMYQHKSRNFTSVEIFLEMSCNYSMITIWYIYLAVIAVTPHPLPYLNALLPKDQDLLAQEEEAQPTPSGKSSKSSQGGAKDGETNDQEGETTDPEAIDNPYLRPVKMARYRKKGGGGNWGLELLCSLEELNKWSNSACGQLKIRNLSEIQRQGQQKLLTLQCCCQKWWSEKAEVKFR